MRAKRIDENQNEIVRTFRDCGCSVCVLSMVGNGVPDICVGYRGANYFFELKSSPKAKLTQAEYRFSVEWDGHLERINSCAEALSYFENVMIK